MANRKLRVRALTNLDPMHHRMALVAGWVEGELPALHKWSWEDRPYGVPNEVICAELGRFLGLPLPPYGITTSNVFNGTIFSTLNINHDGRDFGPVDAAACCEKLPRVCAGTLMFDVFVANCDRHWTNLVVDNDLAPSEMYLYDHDVALFGCFAGEGIQRLRQMRNRLGITGKQPTGGNRHVFLDTIQTQVHFGAWCDRIRNIQTGFIKRTCKRCVKYGLAQAECDEVISFLCDRRDNLRGIVNRHHKEFTKIKQWQSL